MPRKENLALEKQPCTQSRRASHSTSALGYRVQDWDEAGQRWVNARTVESPTFVYDADSAAKVKVTWRKIRSFFFIVR